MDRSTFRHILVVVLALTAVVTHGMAARGANVCSQTADVMQNACENEARDDAWVALGVCLNLGDTAAVRSCRASARDARREAQAECTEQFHARRDLCDAVGGSAYAPVIDPARFLAPSAIAATPNPYFPLVPGTTFSYRGASETGSFQITHDTIVLLGVTCIVVHDVVAVNGVVIEDTDDYFAQDVDGNVWYFGELSRNYEDGRLVDLDGSWRAGVDGALPGIIMFATPETGRTYRQEFALGEAEDAATVLSTTATETAPGASCAGTCVQTLDVTPMDPDAQEHKFYAPGFGNIVTVDLQSGERTELVGITTE